MRSVSDMEPPETRSPLVTCGELLFCVIIPLPIGLMALPASLVVIDPPGFQPWRAALLGGMGLLGCAIPVGYALSVLRDRRRERRAGGRGTVEPRRSP